MARWEPGAHERLQSAALELFAERGFAETSVPQITARAGLTTRTFFRHFSDKREVLFADEPDVPALALRMIAAAPEFDNPLDVIAAGLDAVAAAQFSAGVQALRVRRAVVESDEGLRERELSKMSALSVAIREGFEARGVDALTAAVTAGLTTTVFSVSLDRWINGPDDVALTDLLHETFAALRALVALPAS